MRIDTLADVVWLLTYLLHFILCVHLLRLRPKLTEAPATCPRIVLRVLRAIEYVHIVALLFGVLLGPVGRGLLPGHGDVYCGVYIIATMTILLGAVVTFGMLSTGGAYKH